MPEINQSLFQAAVLAQPPSPVERVAPAPAKPMVVRRQTYAQAQAEWEWVHNKRAQEKIEREKAGFF